jgi:serine/threonine protein kinase
METSTYQTQSVLTKVPTTSTTTTTTLPWAGGLLRRTSSTHEELPCIKLLQKGFDVRKLKLQSETLWATSEFQQWTLMRNVAVDAAVDAFVTFVRQNSHVARHYAAWWASMPLVEREARLGANWMPPEELHRTKATRYEKMRVLQKSLFGEVQLARDKFSTGTRLVAVKVSTRDAVATHITMNGSLVMEDVHREARILCMLSDKSCLTSASIDRETCGLSGGFVQADVSVYAQGRPFITTFLNEMEDETHHYLVSEYMANGDLFKVLNERPHHNLPEIDARKLFRQMSLAVQYMHSLSMVHMDLSLENMCCDEAYNIKLIDLGLAMQHPDYVGDKCVPPGGSSHSHVRLMSMASVTPGCTCDACLVIKDTISGRRLHRSVPSFPRLRFLCAPVCNTIFKPGKTAYMSPELYQRRAWDAYANDTYALGVILYSMLTGRPPYVKPDAKQDVWFNTIYSGAWLDPKVRALPNAVVYNHLSPAAMDLINHLIAPQTERLSIDEILCHPFLKGASR